MTQMLIRIRTEDRKAAVGEVPSPRAVTINGQRFIPDRATTLAAKSTTAGSDDQEESRQVELDIEVT